MGRIPKVKKERALQLQRSVMLTCVPQNPPSALPGRQPTHLSDGMSNGNTSEKTSSTDFVVVGGNSSGVSRHCEETATANGTDSETSVSGETVGSSRSEDSLHAGCSNWVNGERMNSANPDMKHLHRLNVEGATQSTKPYQVTAKLVLCNLR